MENIQEILDDLNKGALLAIIEEQAVQLARKDKELVEARTELVILYKMLE